MGSCGLALAVLLSAVAGCTARDDEAQVKLPQDPIAVGAFLPLNVSDACGLGGGKINFCTAESLVSIDEVTVKDPRVAAILRMTELDEGLRVGSSELVVDAKSAGTTTVTIDSTFDDGSQRKVETTVSVEKPDRMSLVHHCSVRDPDDTSLFPVNAQEPFTLELAAGSQPLRGEHQRDLIEGDGISRERGFLTRNAYVWTAPAKGGATQLTSPLLPKFAVTHRAYDLAALAIDSVALTYDASATYHTYVAFDVALTVDGKRPCEVPPLRIDVMTPEICDGDEGASTWLEESAAYGISVRAVNSGSCELVVSVEGTDVTHPVQVDLEVTDVPAFEPNPCENVVCEDEPTSCADGSELAKRECCTTCVPVPDPEQCELQRAAWDELYDAELAKATACEADADCSSVVLVAGCRRYCHIALNAELTADFMNAITPEYQTSCTACMVAEPATCNTNGRVYCASGECRLFP